MKNKHKRQFVNTFKWWDYGFLMEAISLWCDNASKQQYKNGISVNHKSKAKILKELSVLAKRLQDNDFHVEYCNLYPKISSEMYTVPCDNPDFVEVKFHLYPNDKINYQVSQRLRIQENRNRKYCLDRFCYLLNKHLFHLWD